MAEERKIVLTLDDKGSIKKLEGMEQTTGKIKKGFDDGSKSGKKFSKTVDTIGTAWKAIGIGAIIALLVRLANIFGENQKVADLFAGALEAVSIVTNDFIQFILSNSDKVTGSFKSFFEDPVTKMKEFGTSIKQYVLDKIQAMIDGLGFAGGALKKFFTGDFDGALEDAKKAGDKFLEANPVVDLLKKTVEVGKEAISTVVEYGKTVVKRATDIVKANKAAAISEIDLQAQQLESQKLAERQRQIRDDEQKSIQDRIEANNKLGEILTNQLELEKKAAQQAIHAAQLAYNKTKNDKDLIALKQANLKLLEIEERVEAQTSEQKTNRVALERELLELERSKLQTKRDILDVEAQSLIDLEMVTVEKLRLQREYLDEKYKQEIDDLDKEISKHKVGTQAYQDALNAKKLADAKYTADVKRNNEDQRQADRDLASQKLQIASETFGTLSKILGENSKAGKAAASAQALINTYEGITQIWANDTTLPEPFGTIQKVVATATAAYSGFEAVKNINSTQLPSIAGGSGGGGGGAPAVTAPAFNLIGNAPGSQIADAIGQANKDNEVKLYNNKLEAIQNDNEARVAQTSIG